MDTSNILAQEELASLLVTTIVVAILIGAMTDPAIGGSRAVNAGVAAVIVFVIMGSILAIR